MEQNSTTNFIVRFTVIKLRYVIVRQLSFFSANELLTNKWRNMRLESLVADKNTILPQRIANSKSVSSA